MIETLKTYQGQDVGASQCLITLESFIGDTNEQELDDGTVLDASDAVTAINGLIFSLERREAEIKSLRNDVEKLRSGLSTAIDWIDPESDPMPLQSGEIVALLRMILRFSLEQKLDSTSRAHIAFGDKVVGEPDEY